MVVMIHSLEVDMLKQNGSSKIGKRDYIGVKWGT